MAKKKKRSSACYGNRGDSNEEIKATMKERIAEVQAEWTETIRRSRANMPYCPKDDKNPIPTYPDNIFYEK